MSNQHKISTSICPSCKAKTFDKKKKLNYNQIKFIKNIVQNHSKIIKIFNPNSKNSNLTLYKFFKQIPNIMFPIPFILAALASIFTLSSFATFREIRKQKTKKKYPKFLEQWKKIKNKLK